MVLRNNNQGKFFGPVQVYMGYIFIILGLCCVIYSSATLLLVIPGAFLTFTYNGTIIDTENKRVRPYTTLFGIIRTGKWIEVSGFSGFKIVKSNRRYTSYSRANIKLDLNVSDICLLLVNKNGRRKVVLNRYDNYEDARREMDELKMSLFPLNNIPDINFEKSENSDATTNW
jgi:hypothetical protein